MPVLNTQRVVLKSAGTLNLLRACQSQVDMTPTSYLSGHCGQTTFPRLSRTEMLLAVQILFHVKHI